MSKLECPIIFITKDLDMVTCSKRSSSHLDELKKKEILVLFSNRSGEREIRWKADLPCWLRCRKENLYRVLG